MAIFLAGRRSPPRASRKIQTSRAATCAAMRKPTMLPYPRNGSLLAPPCKQVNALGVCLVHFEQSLFAPFKQCCRRRRRRAHWCHWRHHQAVCCLHACDFSIQGLQSRKVSPSRTWKRHSNACEKSQRRTLHIKEQPCTHSGERELQKKRLGHRWQTLPPHGNPLATWVGIFRTSVE